MSHIIIENKPAISLISLWTPAPTAHAVHVIFPPSICHSPLDFVIRRGVLGGDVGQVSEDLGAIDGEAGQQDELLPGRAEQTGVVLYGELTEERQLLDPGDLAEEQLICQATQQRKQLHLGHFVPGCNKTNNDFGFYLLFGLTLKINLDTI